jgi:hypothetical protein
VRSALTVAVYVCLIGCGRDTGAPSHDERVAQLKRRLSEDVGLQLAAAATEYRKLVGETPDALRTIAAAHRRAREDDAELEVLRTLVIRGQATSDDRVRAVRLLSTRKVDDRAYRIGLKWLSEATLQEPRCTTFALMVEWTDGHQEHDATIDLALSSCPREYERGEWFASRALKLRESADACDAVVNGRVDLAPLCIDGAKAEPWKIDAARGLTGNDRPIRLRNASAAKQATAFVLRELASTPGIARDEACAALTRAQAIELAWVGIGGERSTIEGRYAALRQAASCL